MTVQSDGTVRHDVVVEAAAGGGVLERARQANSRGLRASGRGFLVAQAQEDQIDHGG